ncbi:MAG: hypothetical protein DRJ01_07750 [Bacteroidetes bacterium]|nr:MAG: hypothetical protein DRJ01_07750 [Bacteroidota bacterium]
MMKKTTTRVLIIAFFILLIFVYFYFKQQDTKIYSTINAVPISSSLIIESNDFEGLLNEINNENIIMTETAKIPAIKKVRNSALFLDSIFDRNSEILKLFKEKQIIISSHILGTNSVEFLYLLGLKNSFEGKNAIKTMKNILQNKAVISEREYNSTRIFIAKLNKNKTNECVYFSYKGGVFILSFSQILVENAIRQIDAKYSLTKFSDFRRISKTAGKNVKANIYINYKTFPKLVSLFVNNKYKNKISSFTNFANWSELDANFKKKSILLNGFTYTNDSINNYLNIFLRQKSQTIETTSIFPENTSSFINVGISDINLFFNDYKKYLDKNQDLYSYEKKIKQINDAYKIDLQNIFTSFFDNEIAVVYTDNVDLNNNVFFVVKTKSKSKAKEELFKILTRYSQKKNISVSDLTFNYKIDDEKSYKIYETPVKNLPEKLFGNIFSSSQAGYFTFIDNFLIFGNSVNALKKYIYSIVLNKTINNDSNYNQFEDFLSSKSNFYFYTNISRSVPLYNKYVNNNLKKSLQKNLNTIQKFYALGIQSSSSSNMIYNNVFLKYSPVLKKAANTIWESRLDTIIDFKPKIVVNHRTNAKEIFVQDLKNTIYLINSSGRILWKQNINEKIISDVYQIDFYKNNKLQYLFNTKNHLFIIDRNGNNVEHYPIKLKSPATNPLALFDYNKNKDYRIFIACENKKVYVYNKEGKTLKGWKFDKTENIVNSKIQHYLIKGKDYIVFADTHKIYILDRKGNERVKVSHNFSKSINNNFVYDFRKNALVTTDNNGKVYFINFKGKVESKNFIQCTNNHFFDYKDVDGDNKKDFIFIDNNKLKVINHKNKIVFTHTFKNNITKKSVFFLFDKNKKGIGCVDSKSNKIFLFDKNGEMFNGFPLEGMTLFSICNLNNTKGKYNLIVGNKECFLYNYLVNN